MNLSDLKENFSTGPTIVEDAKFDDKGNQIADAVYGSAPDNITEIPIKCKSGEITNLIDFGLSTQDSMCPSTFLDDVLYVQDLIDAVSTDPRCNYRGL